MSKFKILFTCLVISWVWGLVPCGIAQEPKSQPVYLKEPPVEPPPAVVTHRKAQGKYENGQLRVEREEAILSDDTVVSDGEYVEYYSDGQKFCEGKYKNGVIAGEWSYWHPNGQLRKTIKFTDGRPDGAIETFRPDGSLEAVQSFKKGVRDGEWVTYYEDGKTPKVRMSIANGNLDGQRTTYYPDGTLKQETHFVAGVLDGLVAEYDESGKKTGEAIFEKGQRKSTKKVE